MGTFIFVDMYEYACLGVRGRRVCICVKYLNDVYFVFYVWF